jgi:hypothetical protein
MTRGGAAIANGHRPKAGGPPRHGVGTDAKPAHPAVARRAPPAGAAAAPTRRPLGRAPLSLLASAEVDEGTSAAMSGNTALAADRVGVSRHGDGPCGSSSTASGGAAPIPPASVGTDPGDGGVARQESGEPGYRVGIGRHGEPRHGHGDAESDSREAHVGKPLSRVGVSRHGSQPIQETIQNSPDRQGYDQLGAGNRTPWPHLWKNP